MDAWSRLPQIERVAVLAASSSLAILAFLLGIGSGDTETYRDFLVGRIAWNATSKSQDLIGPALFIIVASLCVVLFSEILARQHADHGADQSNRLANAMLIWTMPAMLAAAGLLSSRNLDHRLLVLSGLAIFAVGAVSASTNRRGEPVDVESLSCALLAAVFVGLWPLAVVLALGRVPMAIFGEFDGQSATTLAHVIGVLGFAAVAVAMAVMGPSRQTVARLLVVAQLPLCALFLVLRPIRLRQPDGVIVGYPTTWWLNVLILGLVALALFDLARRARRTSAAPSDIVSPVVLYALLLALKFGRTASIVLSSDDYHFGEYLLGWHAYLRGAVPYVDYVPAHGVLGNDLPMALSGLFYDGTAATLGEPIRLLFALVGLPSFLAVYRLTGSRLLAFTSLGVVGLRPVWPFLIAFLCLWLAPRLRSKPAQWLAVWLVSAQVVILAAPPQGVLLVGASAPLFVEASWRLVTAGERRSLLTPAAAGFASIVVWLVTPVGPMLRGALGYLLANGPINQVAYGVPWQDSWRRVDVRSPLVFEVVRVGWIVVPIVGLVLCAGALRHKARRSQLVPTLVMVIFAVGVSPYSMGRISDSWASRPGLATMFCLGILLPVVVWDHLGPAGRTRLVLLSGLTGAAMNLAPLGFGELEAAIPQSIESPALTDAAEIGLPAIGTGIFDDAHIERLGRLQRTLDSVLDPGDPYLDLTSRNANYFYLDRPAPVPVTAPYNMAPPSQQREAVRRLRTNLPEVALLEGENILHDGGPLALRAPLLYRFVLDNYRPVMRNGFILGLASAAPAPNVPTVVVDVDPVEDDVWAKGIHTSRSTVVMTDRALALSARVGDEVLAGVERDPWGVIVEIDPSGPYLTFDRPRDELVRVLAGDGSIEVALDSQRFDDYEVRLFERALSTDALWKIPVSWGRSAHELSSRMNLVERPDLATAILHDVTQIDDVFEVRGTSPSVRFEVVAASDQEVGLLMFDFACLGGDDADTRLKVFWTDRGEEVAGEGATVEFTAEDGLLIVPLDASPSWLALSANREIGIGILDGGTACPSFRLGDVELHQRRS